MAAPGADQQLQALLAQHPGVFAPDSHGKLKCELNGHCMPARFDVVSAFVSGPKFKKLLKRREDERLLGELQPFLMPSANYPDKLFCALTCTLLNNTAEAARLHMKGKRFGKAKERFMADEQELLEEPPLEESDLDEDKDKDGDMEEAIAGGASAGQGRTAKAAAAPGKAGAKANPQQPQQRKGGGEPSGGGSGGGEDEDMAREMEEGFWVPDAGRGGAASSGDEEEGEREAGGDGPHAMDEGANGAGARRKGKAAAAAKAARRLEKVAAAAVAAVAAVAEVPSKKAKQGKQPKTKRARV